MGTHSFRDLVVWQRSMDLAKAIYRLTQRFPREEIYGFTSQLRPAGVSVASNIAEGYGRGTKGEYRNFLSIARGSAIEIQTQLEIADELGLGDKPVLERTKELAEETSRLLWSTAHKL